MPRLTEPRPAAPRGRNARCFLVMGAVVGSLAIGGPAPLASEPRDSSASLACSTVLSSGASITVSTPQGTSLGGMTYTEPSGAGRWCAVGVRPTGLDDWDISLWDRRSPDDPYCVDPNSFLVSSGSVQTLVDFVVGDYEFHGTPSQECPVVVHQHGPANGRLEWDSGADEIVVNGAAVTRSTGSSDVLEVWDVQLQANIQYEFSLTHTGSAEARLLLFRNPSPDPYFAARADRVLESTVTTNFVAPAAGWYGLVVVNDNGASGTYTVQVRSCVDAELLPVSSQGISQVRYLSLPSGGMAKFKYTPVNSWVGIGLDSPIAGSSRWRLRLYDDANEDPANCQISNLLATSANPTNLQLGELIVADYSNVYPTPDYVTVEDIAGTDTFARIAYDQAQPIDVDENGNYLDGGTFGLWTTWLWQGGAYHLSVYTPGSGSSNGYLFHNSGTGAAIFTSANALLRFNDPQSTYVAPADGIYSIAVLEDTGLNGFRADIYPVCPVDWLGPDAPGVVQAPWVSFVTKPQSWAAVGVLCEIPYQVRMVQSCEPFQIGGADYFRRDLGLLVNHTEQAVGNRFFQLECEDPFAFPLVHYEWAQDGGELFVNHSFGPRTFEANEILKIFHVNLVQDQAYGFDFKPSPSGHLRMLLFGESGPDWKPRDTRLLDTDRPAVFTALATGSYGVVVLNDAADGGSYTLQVVSPPGVAAPCNDALADGSIGVFFDTQGTTCALVPAFQTQTCRVYATLSGATSQGITAAEFRLAFSDCVGWTIGPWIPVLGSSVTGSPFDCGQLGSQRIRVQFPSCQNGNGTGRVLLGSFQITEPSGNPPLEIRVTQPELPQVNLEAPYMETCGAPPVAVPLTRRVGQLGRDPTLSSAWVQVCPPCTPATQFEPENLTIDLSTGSALAHGAPRIESSATTTQVLAPGEWYRVTVRGNFMPFSQQDWNAFAHRCGTPDVVSAGTGWAQVAAADAEFVYADPVPISTDCSYLPRRDEGLRVTLSPTEVLDPTPVGGVAVGPNSEHLYAYEIQGRGYRATFRVTNRQGGYGIVTVTVTQLVTDAPPPVVTAVPRALRLCGNAPEPFNPSTTIRYELPAHAAISIDIFDVRGARVRRLLRTTQDAGAYHVEWNGRDDAGGRLPSGVYFAHLDAGTSGSADERLTLVK